MVDHFAEEDGPAVAELRHELPELMPGIRHRERLALLRHAVSREHFDALWRRQRLGIEPKLEREFFVELKQPRRSDRRATPGKADRGRAR